MWLYRYGRLVSILKKIYTRSLFQAFIDEIQVYPLYVPPVCARGSYTDSCL